MPGNSWNQKEIKQECQTSPQEKTGVCWQSKSNLTLFKHLQSLWNMDCPRGELLNGLELQKSMVLSAKVRTNSFLMG